MTTTTSNNRKTNMTCQEKITKEDERNTKKEWKGFLFSEGPVGMHACVFCAVDLFSGPMFAFLCVKTGPFFCLFVFEDLVLPAERRGFKKATTKNNLCQIWSIFATYLDQFSAYTWTSS